MVEKRDVIRHLLVAGIVVILVSILIVLKGGFTGFAVFEDFIEGDFNNGSYVNTSYNGSAVVLVGDNLTGSYTSQVFDCDSSAGASWNNLSWSGNKPNIEFLYAVDGSGEVFKSSDFGVTWQLVKENYGRTTDGAYMFSDSDYLYIISNSNREIWRSSDNGESFVVINDSFTNSGLLVGEVDSNDNLFVVDASGDVYKSFNNGVTWSLLSDFNAGASNNAKGIGINSSDDIYIVDGAGDVYSSIDSGVNWVKVNDGYGGSTGTDDLKALGGEVYILLNKDIYESTDGGVTWVLINDSFTSYSNDGLRMTEDNVNLYIADGSGRIWKSINSGISWQELGDFNAGAGSDPKGITVFVESSSLDIQVKSCDDDLCSGESWSDIGDTSPQDLSLDNNQYFQYKFDFTSPDSSISPILENVSIDYTILNTAPVISIVVPQEGGSYGYNESLNLNFSVSDADGNLDSCWYNIDDGNNVSLAGCSNTSFDVSGNGNYVLNIYVNDSLGEEASDSVSFSVQVGAPTIVLYYPIDVYLDNGSSVVFNYTPSDIDLDSCELWGDFSGVFELNQTDVSVVSGVVNSFSLDLEDREYLWNIKCVDDIGNSAFNGNKSFYVDTTNPDLSISEPVGSKTSRTGIVIGFSAGDNNLDNCWYNVYRGDSIEIANTSVDCSGTSSFDVTVDANFAFNLYANDSAGNLNFTDSSFSVDSSSGGGSSGGGSGGGGGGGSSGSVSVIQTQTTKLKVSEIGGVIANEGDKKTLSLNIQNAGTNFLNNCRLLISGEISSWFYNDQIMGIAPGQNIDFIFDLNIPESIGSGDYFGELEVNCNEINESQEIKIIIPGFKLIEIKEIKHEEQGLNISYIFDNSNIIGEDVSVEIWIVDDVEDEIKRYVDSFSINKEGVIERNVLIELPEDLVGIYSVYFAMSSDLDNFVKQNVVLGKSVSTGFAVFDTTGGKMIGYVVFIIIVGVGVFFAIRGHDKKVHKSKNNWLLGMNKKKWFGFRKKKV